MSGKAVSSIYSTLSKKYISEKDVLTKALPATRVTVSGSTRVGEEMKPQGMFVVSEEAMLPTGMPPAMPGNTKRGMSPLPR